MLVKLTTVLFPELSGIMRGAFAVALLLTVIINHISALNKEGSSFYKPFPGKVLDIHTKAHVVYFDLVFGAKAYNFLSTLSYPFFAF